MDIDTFWTLIQDTKQHEGPRSERLVFLREQLIALPSSQIVQFQAHLDRACERGYTWNLIGAATRIFGGRLSDDGFEYFRRWLASLGREVFERAVTQPETLADVPEVQRLAGRHIRDWNGEEWPEWEVLDYVASEAYAHVEGIEDECGTAFFEALNALHGTERLLREPTGDHWDARDEYVATLKLPVLSALFPVTTLS